MEEDREAELKGRTMTKEQWLLDFETVTGPQEFTRAGILMQ